MTIPSISRMYEDTPGPVQQRLIPLIPLSTFGSTKPSKPRACTLDSRGVPHNVLTQHRCCASFSRHSRLSVTNVKEPVGFATPPKQRATPSKSLWVLQHHRLDRGDCCGTLNMVNLFNHKQLRKAASSSETPCATSWSYPHKRAAEASDRGARASSAAP